MNSKIIFFSGVVLLGVLLFVKARVDTVPPVTKKIPAEETVASVLTPSAATPIAAETPPATATEVPATAPNTEVKHGPREAARENKNNQNDIELAMQNEEIEILQNEIQNDEKNPSKDLGLKKRRLQELMDIQSRNH